MIYHSPYHSLSILGLIIASLSQPANAEEASDIERISVWSTAVKSSAPYLNQQNIADKQADHISDLLRTLPGVDVGGAHSLNQRVTIRSMDDRDLKISIDGASQNTYMYHHMGNLQIHADILQSVEIDTGTNSIIYGGLGGAVRFKTKSAQDLLMPGQKVGGRISVGAGDNSGHQFSLTGYGYISENVDALVYFNSVNKDNFKVGGGEILDERGYVEAGTDGKVRGLKGDVTDTLIKLGWDIDALQRLTFSYEHYQDKGNYSYRPDMGMSTDVTIANGTKTPLTWPTEFSRDTYVFNYETSFSDHTVLTAHAFSNLSELYRDESAWSVAASPRFNSMIGTVTGQAKNTGLNLHAQSELNISNLWFETQQLSYGFEHIKHDTDYEFSHYLGTQALSSESSKSSAFFFQSSLSTSEAFTLTPGVRYETYDVDSYVIKRQFNELTWGLSATYQPSQNILIKLSSTELFKGPELSEVFMGAGLGANQNEHLQAETGQNHELSIAYQHSLKSGLINTGATLFQTNLDNYIHDYVPLPNGGPRDTYKQNIGDMDIKGYEIYANIRIDQLTIDANFSHSDSELNAKAIYESRFGGARLDREQGDTFALEAQYQFKTWPLQISWGIHHVDDLPAALDLDGRARLDNSKQGFTVHTLSASWQANYLEGLEIRVGVDNLFDEYYASQASRTGLGDHPVFGELFLLDYEPGRNIKATVSLQF